MRKRRPASDAAAGPSGATTPAIERRTFLQVAGAVAGAAAVGAAPAMVTAQGGPGPRTRLALAGAGAQGLALLRALQGVTGVEVVAVADAYDGRLARAKEIAGEHVQTARDGREVVGRADVDAVIIATPDHLHAPLATAALSAGKDVYLECPVVHAPADVAALGDAAARAKRIVQAGGGWVSSPLFAAARRLVTTGALGRVTFVSGTWDSASALAAWQAPFPPDCSPESIDFAAFLGPAAAQAFDPARFFRWRLYNAFGSGLVGARFVPQLTAVQWLLDLPAPARATAHGARTRWRDGREVPDTIAATFEYEKGVVVSLGATLNGTGREKELRIVGTDATLVITERRLSIVPEPAAEPYPDVGETWAKSYRDWFYMIHGMSRDGLVRGAPPVEKAVETYSCPSAPERPPRISPTSSRRCEPEASRASGWRWASTPRSPGTWR